MKTEVLGQGEPEIAIVACIHGDEPCGLKAFERFKREAIGLNEPVKFILANEKAFYRGERYIDRDLNHAFPGDGDSDSHEERLAARLLEELEGLKVIDFHSSESPKTPFAIVSGLTEETYELARHTCMENLVEISYVEGGMINHLNGVTVEAGPDASPQSAQMTCQILLNLLAAEGVIDQKYDRSEPEVFEVYDRAKGENYEFKAENFVPLEKGEKYAENRENVKKASESFCPVLMSTDGYEDMIGFKGKKKEF
ncbi:MAG: succinylglutamate desuccinylase/aspartoacylase family protein [Candidatus Nanohalobium sp.]